MNNSRGRSRTHNPVAQLKERFNIGQPPKNSSTNCNKQRSRSHSRDHFTSRQRSHLSSKPGHNDNASSSSHNQLPGQTNSTHRPKSKELKGKDHSVSFSNMRSNGTLSSSSDCSSCPLVDPNCSQIQEILSVLKTLQEDMASVHARVHALELADLKMSHLEKHVFSHAQDDVPAPDPSDSSQMLIDDNPHAP
jgi:hypothetical protein